jgi:hypothetical protein
MGELNEFSIPVRLFLKAYPWRRIDPVPWATPNKPLSKSPALFLYGLDHSTRTFGAIHSIRRRTIAGI